MFRFLKHLNLITCHWKVNNNAMKAGSSESALTIFKVKKRNIVVQCISAKNRKLPQNIRKTKGGKPIV
jgi:hypothetical protein